MKAKCISLCLAALLFFTGCLQAQEAHPAQAPGTPEVVVTMDSPTLSPLPTAVSILNTDAPPASREQRPLEALAPLPYSYDLDGDGVEELLDITCTLGEFSQSYGLSLKRGDSVLLIDTLSEEPPSLYLVQPQGSEVPLLLFQGSMGSDDAMLYLYRYEQQCLQALPIEGMETPFYGFIRENAPHKLVISCVLDILGSRVAHTELVLTESDCLQPQDSLWYYNDSLWEQALVVAVDGLYMMLGEGENGEAGSELLLPKGTKLLPIATDKETLLYVRSDSGLSGYLPISVDEYGLCIEAGGYEGDTAFEPPLYAG